LALSWTPPAERFTLSHGLLLLPLLFSSPAAAAVRAGRARRRWARIEGAGERRMIEAAIVVIFSPKDVFFGALR
jgi:hypothetical protein